MATRFAESVSISGNLQVDGSLNSRPRSELIQDNFAIYGIPFSNFRIWDAFQTGISTAASDDLGLSTGGTWGTNNPYISAGDLKAAGATTRRTRFLFTLPPEYVTGESVRIVATAGMVTTAADTSCTVDFEVYLCAKTTLASGSDLVTTSATTINSTSFATKNFDLTSAGLTAGDMLDIRISIACTDAATVTAVIPAIAHLALALDIKG